MPIKASGQTLDAALLLCLALAWLWDVCLTHRKWYFQLHAMGQRANLRS
jgi:hypothetical protein